jgi:uncharacterized protein (TIGR02271 family)
MNTGDQVRRAPAWVEPAVAVAAIVGLLVAAAVAGDFAAPTAWTLVAAVAAASMLARGAARGCWPGLVAAASARDEPEATTQRLSTEPEATTERRSADGPEVELHEERLYVDRRSRPRERVRVHRHVVTEEVTVTVPLRREELRIERVPVDAPPDPTAEADFTLMEDEPVVETRVVVRERVRLEVAEVTEEREVEVPLRRERADVQTTNIEENEHR